MKTPHALEQYWEKRDFAQTAEPSGKNDARQRRSARPSTGLSFVVQRHQARHLHYDFRLEVDGVLKSWAVPKGPSRDPEVKRLAVAVEDHPLAYGRFEGEIPKGQYGAGTVEIWDSGIWLPDGDPAAGLARGRLRFGLTGGKLRGEWILIRTGKGRQWLLRKLDDAHAVPGDDAERPVAEGRNQAPVHKPSRTAPKRMVQTKRLGDMPEHIEPQLATLVDAVPRDKGWIYELKYDGYRMLCRLDESGARFISRNGNDWTSRMAPLAQALTRLLPGHGWLDGEIVVFDHSGKSNFQRLQNALDNASNELHFVAFDLPWWNGQDLRGATLEARQASLAEILQYVPGDAPITLTDRFSLDGPASAETMLEQACSLGLEGLIAKDAAAPYTSGRSRTWLKLKCRPRQEFVVGGFTSPAGSRKGFGSLLVGLSTDDGLRYAGRVGSGFNTESLALLTRRLENLQAPRSPFHTELPPAHRRFAGPKRDIQWVHPELVIEVDFSGWTSDGFLRQASFKGVREDKPAQAGDIVSKVRISSPRRIVFHDPDIEKLDVARYYEAVAPYLMPHIAKRRLAFLRCPEGTSKPCFFQKHIAENLPTGLKRDGEHILVANARGVIELAQRGVIELHSWGSTLPKADRADRITLDLDPGPGVDWPALVEAARLTEVLMRELGLEPFLKTTGGKGLHVVAPIRRTLDWANAKAFARAMATHLADLMPDRFTANMSKRRRVGRIYVDYLRNGENATAIAAYSLRARDGAPASMPMAWDDLDEKHDLRGAVFNLQNVPDLLARREDPWKNYASAAKTVTRQTLDHMNVKID